MEPSPIQLHVPIFVSYPALEAAAQKKMVGEYINQPGAARGEDPYAQVLDVRIAPSSTGAWDLVLLVKVKILRTLLKRDSVDLQVPVSLGYDNERQLLFLHKYKVDVRTQSRFYNASLEVLANTVAYDTVIKKARFDLRERIGQEVAKVNAQLAEGLTVKGARLSGAVTRVQVSDIEAQEEGVALSLQLSGQLSVAVFDLLSLMPAR